MSDYSYDMSCEDENEIMEEEFKIDETPKALEFLLAADIWSQVHKSCNSLSELVSCSFDESIILLASNSWNHERIMDLFLSDPSKLFRTLSSNSPDKSMNNLIEKNLCLLCLEKSEETNLACGHGLCNTCWAEYLTFNLSSKDSSTLIKCPHDKCGYIIRYQFMKDLLGNDLIPIIQNKICKSYTEDNKWIKWCPAPGCNYSVKNLFGMFGNEIKCKCGFFFCFSCGEELHSPCSCIHAETWLSNFSKDSENLNWIKQNSKLCPKCRKPIERNQGCNHMTCNYANCKHEFCWVCLGSWEDHKQNYNCNKIQDMTKIGQFKHSQEKFDREKSELERSVFYLDRFKIFSGKLKTANSLRKRFIGEIPSICEKYSLNYFDTEYLQNACDSLIYFLNCLKWSYVAGYFLNIKSKLELFEHTQANLEKNTEILFEILEVQIRQSIKDVDSKFGLENKDWRMKILTILDITQKCLKSFTDSMENEIYN